MSVIPFKGADRSVDGGPWEPPRHGHRLHLFRARCAGLRVWSEALGFPVSFLGVATDPLAAVQELSRMSFGCAALVSDIIMEDGHEWDDWTLEAIMLRRSSETVEPWGGTLRFMLPSTADEVEFRWLLRARLAIDHVSQSVFQPDFVQKRLDSGAMPPAYPRYVRDARSWRVVDELYHWADEGADERAVQALERALSLACAPSERTRAETGL